LAGNKRNIDKLNTLFGLLAGVDDTYGKLPINLKLEIEKISQGLTEFGPRKLQRSGPGTEYFESRDFRPEVDELKSINARLSAKFGRDIVVEKEAEIRQHFYLWRDATPSMNYASEGAHCTKKQASEIMLLAFAKHLAKNEELIGVLGNKGAFRGGKAPQSIAGQLMNVNIVTGDMPEMNRRLPRNSTVVMFSDFFMDLDDLKKSLLQLHGSSLRGYMVMVLDPEEIDFTFKGHVEFEGLEGEGKKRDTKAETLKEQYQEKMRQHIDNLQELARAKGFRFILQRTDEPLHDALLSIYGISSKSPVNSFSKGPM
jgi:uncharacterized protein (DUF58 family)